MYQTAGPSSSSDGSLSTGIHIADLEEEIDFENVRDNEGEAANYGIYFDDSQYDYMQHLRDIGDGNEDAHFMDSASVRIKGRGKSKLIKLEDALKEVDLGSDAGDLGWRSTAGDTIASDVTSSSIKRTYQDQQDIPDEIAGFQPDMDPRLREVLEALDDEAYVDPKDEEDVLGVLVKGATTGEVNLEDFEASFVDDDDGWESDKTERPLGGQSPHFDIESPPSLAAVDDHNLQELSLSDADAAVAADGEWLKAFAKFKRESKSVVSQKPPIEPSIASSSNVQAPSTLYTLGGTPLRKKVRKGALTNPSAYSMTSASLARTEGQELLDARFGRMAEQYSLDQADEGLGDDEDGGVSIVSGLSKQSKMSTLSTKSFQDGPARHDLDSMMDGFLERWKEGNPGGGKRVGTKGKRGKNGNEAVGMAMLDEIRQGLGPARIKG